MSAHNIKDSHTHIVWDLPLRLFHWCLVLCVIGAIVSAKAERLEIHQHFGMAVMGLVLFRLIWGVAGSQTAQFRHFICGPSAAIAVISQIRHAQADKRAGHSALGGYAVILLLSICLVMSVTGAFSTDDILFEGPFVWLMPTLSPLAETLHHLTEKALFAIIFLHLTAMLVYFFRLKKNLVRAMVTGRHKGLIGMNGFITPLHNGLGLILLASCLIASQLPIFFKPSLF